MKRSGIALFALLTLLLAGTSVAGPPLDGNYESTDLGGPVHVGRYTEAWDPGGGALLAGTTLNAESWDGANLGTQWRYWCGSLINDGVLLTDNVDANGNGNRTYIKTFVGGFIWLSGAGPWANGDPDYPGTIDIYVEFETITYDAWIPVAAIHMFQLTDHPNGSEVPPTYGLRIDELIGSGAFTFSFEYIDGSGSSNMMLHYDDVLGEIHIFGRAYGGKDIGGGWDATLQGWIDVDFTYRDFITEADDCPGNPGNDLYVTAESPNNTGAITLDGWGGDAVFNFDGKTNGSGCSFIFDNDTDSKGNSTIANDLMLYSGSGWLKPPTDGSRDWLFVGHMLTVPVEETTWGAVKALYRE